MGFREELSITRADVNARLAEDGDVRPAEDGWAVAADALDISPGLAYMVGAGVPADRSGDPSLDERLAPELQLSSPQRLVNPRPHNPLRNERVLAWVQARAQRELTSHATGTAHAASRTHSGAAE